MAAANPGVEPVEDSIRDADEPGHRLTKNRSGLDLTVFAASAARRS